MAKTAVSEQVELGRTVARGSRRRIGPALVVGCVALVLGLCWEFRRPWFRGNLGVVDPGLVIRSAQPTAELERWVRDYRLKSILNLRGGSQADWWYVAEVRTADDFGLAFYDLQLSASRRPRRHELLKLVDVFAECPYPLLIHCKSGADRTGLASAIYRMMRRGEGPDRAEQAFSVEFGHIPVGGSEHLHEPLNEYSAWLKAHQLTHTPERFRTWVKNDYRDEDPPTDPPHIEPGPRVRKH